MGNNFVNTHEMMVGFYFVTSVRYLNMPDTRKDDDDDDDDDDTDNSKCHLYCNLSASSIQIINLLEKAQQLF
jgi:hypothetical protein